MKTPWLLIDSNYLCWRAFHSMGELSHEGVRTGVLFGFFKEILTLTDLFLTQRVAFCFDSSHSKRRDALACYKTTREDKYKNQTTEEKEAHAQMRTQILRLRRHYLPALGYSNILHQKGYEADDLIASACASLPTGRRAIIVSSDHDLYQLLSDQVIFYNPAKKASITKESFSKEFGIGPSQWPDCKAIAGCKTDDVPGIKGVGEKTAAKFLAGKLKQGSAAFDKIVRGNHIWRQNLPIVQLPFPGTETPQLRKDAPVDPKKWDKVMEDLGMSSLFGRRPQAKRKFKSYGYKGK